MYICMHVWQMKKERAATERATRQRAKESDIKWLGCENSEEMK